MSFLASTYAWQRRLLAGGLVVVALGFWRATYDVFNTFKATVIALALLGICVAGALRVARTRRLRVPASPAVWGPLALFALALVVATGAALVLAVWVLDNPRVAPPRKRALLGGGAGLLLLGALAFALGVGPLGELRASALRSLATRTPKWATALAMWQDQPLFGVGLNTFGDYFYRYRPASLAAE